MTLAERILADRCEHVTGNQLLCANCRQSAAAIVEAADRFVSAQEQLEDERPDFTDETMKRVKETFAALAAAGRPHAEKP